MYNFYLGTSVLIFSFLSTISLYSLDVSLILREKHSQKPVSLATVVVKEKKTKEYSSGSGVVKFTLEKGRYTLHIRGVGFEDLIKEITVTKKDTIFSFELDVLKTQGKEILIRSSNPKQELGRNSLTQKSIKEIPGTQGDAFTAVTVFPGISRSNSNAGSLILRGVPLEGNGYFVDGIPLFYPQHFGGLQFVISNEIIKTLDVYSSNAPLDFGQTYGGVISVDTKDKVKEFSGYFDISLLYSSVYFEGPFVEKSFLKDGTDRQFGFWIASVRVGYLEFTVFPLIRLLFEEFEIPSPQYFDFQFKFTFWLDKDKDHELTILSFGSGNILDIGLGFLEDEKDIRLDNGEDPLLLGATIENKYFNNIISFTYKYTALDWLINRFKIYTTINYTNVKLGANVAERVLGDSEIDRSSFPNVTAFEDLLEIPLSFGRFNLDLSSLIGYRLYSFSNQGQNFILETLPDPTRAYFPDFLLEKINFTELDFRGYNHTIYGFLKAKFSRHGFFGELGSRFEYLDRTGDIVFDPRAIIGYSFSSGTKISAATGLYHLFPQVNFLYFNEVSLYSFLDLTTNNTVDAESSWQSTAGIEQTFLKVYSIKVEGFYNYISNRVAINAEEGDPYLSTIQHRSYGVNFLLEGAIQLKENILYGLLSYNYSISENKTNLLTDPNGDQFVPFSHDVPHTLGLLIGYKFKRHEIGFRFSLSSGLPYTPIIGTNCPDPSYELDATCVIDIDDEAVERYSPVYGDRNSARFPLSHKLDVRYTYTKNYSWGIFRFYIGIINAYYYTSAAQQLFRYNEPFNKGDNPRIQVDNRIVPILPTFGFEFTF